MKNNYKLLSLIIIASIAGIVIGQGISETSGFLMFGYIGGGIIAVISLLIVAARIFSGITKPVDIITGACGLMAEGKYEDINLPDGGSEEIRNMYKSFDEMKNRVKTVTAATRESMSNLALMTDKFSSVSADLLTNADGKFNKNSEVISYISAISQTLSNTAANAAGISESTEEISELISYGKDTNKYSLESISRITTVFNDASETMETLGNSSGEIEKIISVINDIASQTNLLALNAAIEAARAGEHGRGFAVVADEVKKLAEKTAKSTEEITGKINLIQTESQKSVETVKKTREEIEKTAKLMQAVTQCFDSISSTANRTSEEAKNINKILHDSKGLDEDTLRNISCCLEETRDEADSLKNTASAFSTIIDDIKRQISMATPHA